MVWTPLGGPCQFHFDAEQIVDTANSVKVANASKSQKIAE
jgi:hypothetical protein